MWIEEMINELQQRMGADATYAEACAMADLLQVRNIYQIADLEDITDKEFFDLIPEAIEHSKIVARYKKGDQQTK